MTMEFVNPRWKEGKEYLENGVQLANVNSLSIAFNILSQLKPFVLKEEAQKELTFDIVRALSALALFDPIIQNKILYVNEAEKYDPDSADVLNNLGYVHHHYHGNWDKSIEYYQRCLEVDPQNIKSNLGIIDVYRTLRHHTLEYEYCKKALENCPESPEIWNSLGLAMLNTRKFENIDAILECFHKGLSFPSEGSVQSKLLVNIGHIYGVIGNFAGAISCYLQAIKADCNHMLAYQNILLNLEYYSDEDIHDPVFTKVMQTFKVIRQKGEPISVLIDKLHEAICLEMYGVNSVNEIDETRSAINRILKPESKRQLKLKKRAEDLGKITKMYPKVVVPNRGKITAKIRVGYISGDLFEHAVSYFSKSILTKPSRDSFDIFIYANAVYDESSIKQLSFTEYRCINTMSTELAADLIRKDKIDILIDLSGHTSGNRLDVLSLHPAPVLLTYLGYPHDIGIPFVKRISDVFTERFNKGNNTPYQLDRLFLQYTPTSENSVEEYAKRYVHFSPKKSMVRFGCFAKLPKINDHVIKVWLQILKKCENSVLVLKSQYFSDPKIEKQWKEKFSPFSNRVELLKGTKSPIEHIKLYKNLDIHLDTFPYCGTTITTESLYMNVPVVTLCPNKRGTAHVQRVSGSILSSMNLSEECIADTEIEYIEKAIGLIEKLPHLHVRNRFLKSEISDSKSFMQSYEKLLSDIFVESA